MKNHRIIITGASGFIGSNIVKTLIKNNYKNLLSIDINSSPTEPIKKVIGSFSDKNLLNKHIKKDDIVIHLACSSAPALSEKDKKKDIEDNVQGTLKLLDVCKEKKIKKLIYFSSGGTVYGEQNQPIREETKTSPTNSHGLMKLAIEKEIKKFSHLHKLNYIIVRPSNPYGREIENKKNQGLIDIFLKKIINNENLEIWGNGEIVRDYIHINDLCNFIVKLIEKDINNETFNIGTGVGASINEIIKIIQEVSGEKTKIKYSPCRNFDLPYNVLNIEKAKKKLNWEPKINIKNGIKLASSKLKK